MAKVTQQEQIGFRCVKAISDEADFAMPPMAKFVASDGSFQSGRFAAWAVVRPWQWTKVAALASNSRRATVALCDRLRKDLAGGALSKEIATLNRAELLDAKH